MGRVIVVGSLNMDLFVRFQHLPQEGETLIGDSFDRFPGGKGANQAVAAARIGAATVLNPAQTLDSTVLQHVQVLTPNEIEAAQLTKCPVTSIDDAKKAARFANAVAAISVTRPGAQPAMPSLQDVSHRFGPTFK